MNHFSNFAAMLSSELQLYLMEHDEPLPANAMVVFEVTGEDDFNKWHEKVSMQGREANQPVVKVKVQKWRRHSAIEKVTFVKAA
jgi:hypothetical protein